MFVSTPENLAILEVLTSRLSHLQIGEVLETHHIDNLCKGKKHLVYNARRAVEKKEGCAFATVRGVGIKKLEADAVVTLGQKARKGAFRKISNTKQVIVGFIHANEDMDRETKLKAAAEAAKCGLVLEFLK